MSLYYTHVFAHLRLIGKWHGVAYLQAKTVPMNLIWSELAQRLMSSSARKVPRAFIMPMGMPMWLPTANDHDATHVQTKTVPMKLILSELAQCLWGSCIQKFKLRETIYVHGTFMWPWWANNYDVAYLQAKTVPMNLIWSEPAWWLRYCVCKVWGVRINGRADERTNGQRQFRSQSLSFRIGTGPKSAHKGMQSCWLFMYWDLFQCSSKPSTSPHNTSALIFYSFVFPPF